METHGDEQKVDAAVCPWDQLLDLTTAKKHAVCSDTALMARQVAYGAACVELLRARPPFLTRKPQHVMDLLPDEGGEPRGVRTVARALLDFTRTSRGACVSVSPRRGISRALLNRLEQVAQGSAEDGTTDLRNLTLTARLAYITNGWASDRDMVRSLLAAEAVASCFLGCGTSAGPCHRSSVLELACPSHYMWSIVPLTASQHASVGQLYRRLRAFLCDMCSHSVSRVPGMEQHLRCETMMRIEDDNSILVGRHIRLTAEGFGIVDRWADRRIAEIILRWATDPASALQALARGRPNSKACTFCHDRLSSDEDLQRGASAFCQRTWAGLFEPFPPLDPRGDGPLPERAVRALVDRSDILRSMADEGLLDVDRLEESLRRAVPADIMERVGRDRFAAALRLVARQADERGPVVAVPPEMVVPTAFLSDYLCIDPMPWLHKVFDIALFDLRPLALQCLNPPVSAVDEPEPEPEPEAKRIRV